MPVPNRSPAWRLAGACATVIGASAGHPAHAQLAGSISVESDTYLRGYSISDNQPTITGQVDYDTQAGVYVSGSATSTLVNGTAKFVGWQGDIGFVRRLNRMLSMDLGVSRVDFRQVDVYSKGISYNEIYTGLTYRPVTLRLSYSPEYQASHTQTLYADLAISQAVARHLVISAHLAELLYLNQPAPARTRYYDTSATAFPYQPDNCDWSLSATRQLGPFELRASLIGAGNRGSPVARANRPASATVGAIWSF